MGQQVCSRPVSAQEQVGLVSLVTGLNLP